MKYVPVLFVFLFIPCFSAEISSFFNWPKTVTLEKPVVDFISSAKKTLDVCAYHLEHPAVGDALKNAVKRLGPSCVRLVTETTYYENPKYTIYKELEALGVKIVKDIDGDGVDRGLMHNKFIIADRNSVLTGSTNLTVSCISKNNNNVVIINSNPLSEYFRSEFEQMLSGRFSTRKNSLPAFSQTLENSRIEVLFAPKAPVRQKILQLIESASHNISFCIFTFTDSEIIQALIRKKNQGVLVCGTMDRLQAGSSYSAYEVLSENGISIRKDGNSGLLHNKFLVVDAGTDSDPAVLTGSYNWTDSASTNNDENTLVIHDSQTASLFYNEAEKIFSAGSSEKSDSAFNIELCSVKLLNLESADDDTEAYWFQNDFSEHNISLILRLTGNSI